ncbi:MAG: hypothetical protein ACRD29_26030 [Acidimicrobiales bacterium]
MPDPASATAIIGAGAAIFGTVKGVHDLAYAHEGEKGFNLKSAPKALTYPEELEGSFLPAGNHYAQADVLHFQAVGGYWTNNLYVSMSGWFSHTNEDPVGYPDTHVNLPANRWMRDVKFVKSGNSESLSSGLCEVNIEPYTDPGGSPENPMLVSKVHGRFDPVGPGDYYYEFLLYVDSHGQVGMSNASPTSGPLTVTDQGSYVLIHMDSRQVASSWF